jgi:peptidoglycan hydrolase-like protein with peptidoglycan-binding domain
LGVSQLKLTYSGFDSGPVDGWLGKKMQGVLSEFQTSRTLSVLGKLDNATAAALEAAQA